VTHKTARRKGAQDRKECKRAQGQIPSWREVSRGLPLGKFEGGEILQEGGGTGVPVGGRGRNFTKRLVSP